MSNKMEGTFMILSACRTDGKTQAAGVFNYFCLVRFMSWHKHTDWRASANTHETES